MNVDGLPRMVSRRNTENKARLDVDDIFSLMDALDEKRLLDKLPKFVAHDPAKLPPLKTSDLDMCLLAIRVAALEEQLTNVVSKCVDQAFGSIRNIKEVQQIDKVHSEAIMSVQLATEQPQMSTSADDRDDLSIQPSWADLIKDFQDDDFETKSRGRPSLSKKAKNQITIPSTNCTKNTNKAQIRHSLRGTKTTSESGDSGDSGDSGVTSVTAVPRRITAFVGRLSLDTTADDLSNHMTAAGMKETKCIKLTPKDGQSFKTAAFMVSCSVVSEAEFYTESNWPLGCELRDWHFKSKSSPSSL